MRRRVWEVGKNLRRGLRWENASKEGTVGIEMRGCFRERACGGCDGGMLLGEPMGVLPTDQDLSVAGAEDCEAAAFEEGTRVAFKSPQPCEPGCSSQVERRCPQCSRPSALVEEGTLTVKRKSEHPFTRRRALNLAGASIHLASKCH